MSHHLRHVVLGMTLFVLLGLAAFPASAQTNPMIDIFEGPTTGADNTVEQQTIILGSTAGYLNFNFTPTAGYVVMMEQGNPNNPADNQNVANWSDVVAFGLAGVGRGSKSISLFSDVEGVPNNTTFGSGTGTVPNFVDLLKLSPSQFRYILEGSDGTVTYIPANADPGGNATVKPTYVFHSDSDTNVPEPSVLSLGGAALPVLLMCCSRPLRRSRRPDRARLPA